jgi:hypothetical protein
MSRSTNRGRGDRVRDRQLARRRRADQRLHDARRAQQHAARAEMEAVDRERMRNLLRLGVSVADIARIIAGDDVQAVRRTLDALQDLLGDLWGVDERVDCEHVAIAVLELNTLDDLALQAATRP